MGKKGKNGKAQNGKNGTVGLKEGALPAGRAAAVKAAVAGYQGRITGHITGRITGKGGRPKSAPRGIDRGTPELQARRALDEGRRRNPQLLAYPLGVLYENDQIGAEMWEAACRYAWLYNRVVRPRRARACSAAEAWAEGHAELDDETEAAIERDYREAADFLARVPAIKRAVDDLVIFERRPDWMGPVVPTARHMDQAALFMVGLQQLCRLMLWQRGHRRRDVVASPVDRDRGAA